MGNVPTKETRLRLLSLLSQTVPARRPHRRHTASSGSLRLAGKEDRLRSREKHHMDLVVRFRELVDGGYLAPFGTYKLNLDFDTQVVRTLIVERRLAPFFTPLQDFDELWTPSELVTLVRQLPLHALDAAYESNDEDEEDDHKPHRLLNYHKRQEQKRLHAAMLERVKRKQQDSETEYEEARRKGTDPSLPLTDLLTRLYGNASECPICFLYFPQPLNNSRCCRQPICTECFVQIKRLDPHPPQDEDSENPHTLLSEPAKCPYCAMPNFGVTYEPPRDLYVGIGAPTTPGAFRAYSAIMETSEAEATDATADATEDKDADTAVVESEASPVLSRAQRKPRRRSSVAADSDTVILTDYIRPDWEVKLAAARSKLARKAATASAIHALNLLIGDSNRPLMLMSLEDRMVEEAIKLLLLEEEERRTGERLAARLASSPQTR